MVQSVQEGVLAAPDIFFRPAGMQDLDRVHQLEVSGSWAPLVVPPLPAAMPGPLLLPY